MSHQFRINKEYADKYNTWRQKEELQKLKHKYGDTILDDESETSSSESEDEDAEALTEQVEKDWLRTLAALKSKDPSIYNKDVKFYKDDSGSEDTDDEESNRKKKKKKDKPLFLKDYDRKVIVEKGGILSDEDDLSDEGPGTSLADRKGYYEEQEELRKSLAAATADSDADSSNDGELLTKRAKTKSEKDQEQTGYLQWMKGQKSLTTEKEVGVELAPLKEYWHDPGLDPGEKFLRDFILNKQYIDREDDSIPTYDEVVNDGDGFSDEEELLVKQDDFERKYNFRFEEPDAQKIQSFPRVLEDSVRRKDAKRSQKRQEVKERKKREKERKKEEIKQLKKLKRQEIMTKIDQLKEITGNRSLGIDETQLDDDFDPQKHDTMMQKYFDEQYYNEGEGEEVKPVFDDDLSDDGAGDGGWDTWTGVGGAGDGERADGPHVDDPDFCMDADYDPSQRPQKKKKSKKNKLSQALAAKKPVFDPKEKTFEEYFDEYYKLDYEDIIDDMPCRFKYRKVMSNDYGLGVDEVLKCRDKELNAWVSLKKMSQYRTEQEEQGDLRVYSKKGKNLKKKGNLLPSLFHVDDEDDRRQKQKSSKGKADLRHVDADNTETEDVSLSKKGKRKYTESVDDTVVGKKQKLQSGEETPKKKKKKKKKNSTLDDIVVEKVSNETKSVDECARSDIKSESTKKKKKRKHEPESSSLTSVKSKQEGDSTSVKSPTKSEAKIKMVNSETNNDSKTELTGKGKKKRNKKKKNKEGQKLKMSDERLKAYGINPKKYKYMQKEELFQIKPRTEKT